MKKSVLWLLVVPVLVMAAMASPVVTATNGEGAVAQTTGAKLMVYGAGGPLAPMRECLEVFKQRTGVDYEITAGPTGTWLEKAKADGDLVYFGAEFVMDAFEYGRTYAGDARLVTEGLIIPESRESTWDRGSGILVRPGNPKKIRTLADLARPGIKVLVVHGAGQTGLWEDMAAKARLVGPIQKNIAMVAADGADAIRQWNTLTDLDAWITWESWWYRLPDTTELVRVGEKLTVYRGTPIAILARSTQTQEASAFIEFLKTREAHAIFVKWGWAR